MKHAFQTTLVATGLLLAALPVSAQQDETFEGRMSPRPIDGRLRGQLTGAGMIEAELDGTELGVVARFEGMQTPPTRATLRRGLTMGVAGPAIADLEIVEAFDGSGVIRGSASLDRSQIDSLRDGAIYVQVDGEGDQDGTLWGFLVAE